MSNPVLDRLNRVDNGRAGRKSEKNLSKRIGGKQRIGSGAIAGLKGDILKDGFLLEAKSTVGESFSVKKEWLLKIYQEALEETKTPAFAINFTDSSGKSEKRERWVAVPEHIWVEIIDGHEDK